MSYSVSLSLSLPIYKMGRVAPTSKDCVGVRTGLSQSAQHAWCCPHMPIGRGDSAVTAMWFPLLMSGWETGVLWGPGIPLANGGQAPGGVVTAGHGTRHSCTGGHLPCLVGQLTRKLKGTCCLHSPLWAPSFSLLLTVRSVLSPGLVLRHVCFHGSLLAGPLLPTRLPYPRNHVGVGTKHHPLCSLSSFSGKWALITPGPSLLLKNPKYDCEYSCCSCHWF